MWEQKDICLPQVKKYYKSKKKLVNESVFQYTVMQKNMICRVVAEEKEKEK